MSCQSYNISFDSALRLSPNSFPINLDRSSPNVIRRNQAICSESSFPRTQLNSQSQETPTMLRTFAGVHFTYPFMQLSLDNPSSSEHIIRGRGQACGTMDQALA